MSATTGIRLAGGAPIPPAPAWGVYRPASLRGRHIGGVTELAPGHHVPVCVARDCYRALPARDTYAGGKKALRDHWLQEHAAGVA